MVRESGNRPAIQVEHKGEAKRIFPEGILAISLTHMKQIAENHLGQAVTHAVLTAPADKHTFI